MSTTRVIQSARLAWRDGQPFSTDYDDIYHTADGAAEVRRVFTGPSGLPHRFEQDPFVIGELGFGTALNFAVTAQQFLEHGAGGRLHFVSFEQHPLAADDFNRVAAARRQELTLYPRLAEVQPPLLPGWHRRHFYDGRITLSVYYGSAAHGLSDLLGRARPFDAWYLDGFAPDRNPDMWTDEVLHAIGSLSNPGTTVTTFTSVGDVRRSLTAAGFSVERLDQRPHKLHTLRGVYAGKATPIRSRTRQATVVGAGIAGAAAARRLAELDVAVVLLDAGPTPANTLPATVLHPRLRADDSHAARLRVAAFDHACHALSQHLDPMRPGVLQLPGPNWDEERRSRAIAHWLPTGNWLTPLTAAQASDVLGRRCSLPGVHFPTGANINLASIGERLTDHANITVERNTQAIDLATFGDLVLCTGPATTEFDEACYLELLPMWGQLELIALEDAPSLPVLSDGYLAPVEGGLALGATYERSPWAPERASRQNLERFHDWWTLATGTAPAVRHHGIVRGVRSVTSDRLPIIGPLHDRQRQPLPNLQISAGHGSSGTSFALLAAECVASELAGEFAPLTKDALAAVSGLRFLERQARRGLKHGARERP